MSMTTFAHTPTYSADIVGAYQNIYEISSLNDSFKPAFFTDSTHIVHDGWVDGTYGTAELQNGIRKSFVPRSSSLDMSDCSIRMYQHHVVDCGDSRPIYMRRGHPLYSSTVPPTASVWITNPTQGYEGCATITAPPGWDFTGASLGGYAYTPGYTVNTNGTLTCVYTVRQRYQDAYYLWRTRYKMMRCTISLRTGAVTSKSTVSPPIGSTWGDEWVSVGSVSAWMSVGSTDSIHIIFSAKRLTESYSRVYIGKISGTSFEWYTAISPTDASHLTHHLRMYHVGEHLVTVGDERVSVLSSSTGVRTHGWINPGIGDVLGIAHDIIYGANGCYDLLTGARVGEAILNSIPQSSTIPIYIDALPVRPKTIRWGVRSITDINALSDPVSYMDREWNVKLYDRYLYHLRAQVDAACKAYIDPATHLPSTLAAVYPVALGGEYHTEGETWTRTSVAGTRLYDVDIGEIHQILRFLFSQAGRELEYDR